MTLKEGVNALLVKLTQEGGQWAMALRFAPPDSGKIEGLTVENPDRKRIGEMSEKRVHGPESERDIWFR